MADVAATLTAVRDGHTFWYRFDDAARHGPLVPFERRVLDPQEAAYLDELNGQFHACGRERLRYQQVVALLQQRTPLYFPHATGHPSPVYEGLARVVQEGRELTIETNDLTFGFDLTVIEGRVLGMTVPVAYKLLTPCLHPDQPPRPPDLELPPATLLVANPSSNRALAGAEAEVATLYGRLTQSGAKAALLAGSQVTLATLATRLAAAEADVIYIAGEFDGDGLPLSDGERLKPEHILRYVACGGSTFILNGCSSLQGFAFPFLLRGAAHLIGTSHDISDHSAWRFGLTLHEVSAAGAHPSRWLYTAKALYHRHYQDDASPLFYHLCSTTSAMNGAAEPCGLSPQRGASTGINRPWSAVTSARTLPGDIVTPRASTCDELWQERGFPLPTELASPVPSAIALRDGYPGLSAYQDGVQCWVAKQTRSMQPEKTGTIRRLCRFVVSTLLTVLDALEDGPVACLRPWAAQRAGIVESHEVLMGKR
jgi:hypothetical protein